MALNVNALKVKVKKAIMKLPDTVDIYREKQDSRREPMGDEFVVQLTGQYYKGRNSFISLTLADRGEVKSKNPERFMVVIDEESQQVLEGDRFTLKGVQYKIADLGNTLDVYFDFALERV